MKNRFLLTLLATLCAAIAVTGSCSSIATAQGEAAVRLIPVFEDMLSREDQGRDHGSRRCRYWKLKCKEQNDTFEDYRHCMRKHKQCTGPNRVPNLEFYKRNCKDHRWRCLIHNPPGRARTKCLGKRPECRHRQKVINHQYESPRCIYWRKECRKDFYFNSRKYKNCIRNIKGCETKFEYPDQW